MRFREALQIVARRLGLAGRSNARLGLAGTSLLVGSALLALGALSAAVAAVGAGAWLYGLAAGIRALFLGEELSE